MMIIMTIMMMMMMMTSRPVLKTFSQVRESSDRNRQGRIFCNRFK